MINHTRYASLNPYGYGISTREKFDCVSEEEMEPSQNVTMNISTNTPYLYCVPIDWRDLPQAEDNHDDEERHRWDKTDRWWP